MVNLIAIVLGEITVLSRGAVGMILFATFVLRFTLLLFVIALVPLAASAAEFRIRQGPYSGHFDVKVIELTGDIASGDSGRLKALFDANFKCGDGPGDCNPHSAMASLNSVGGDYKEGNELARFFRENSVATIVESGNVCLSACAIAFLGGTGFWATGGVGYFVARYMEPGARIGFHAPYLKPDDAQEIARSNLPLVLQTNRLDNETLANVINTYFVDPTSSEASS